MKTENDNENNPKFTRIFPRRFERKFYRNGRILYDVVQRLLSFLIVESELT